MRNYTIFSKDIFKDRFKRNRLIIYSYLLIFNIIIIFLLLSIGKSVYTSRITKSNYEKQQKFNISIALNLNYVLQYYHKFIIHSANNLNFEEIDNQKYIDKYINTYSNLVNIFNNGIYLFDANGSLLGEYPEYSNRAGMSFNHRQYFKDTISSGKPLISDPYISSLHHAHPCIMFTAPIFNKYGKIIAIFGGSIDLAKTNFLNQPLSINFSDYSYFTLYNNDGLVVYHPKSQYVLTKVSKVNLLNTRELTDFDGLEVIRDVQYVPYAKWFVSLNIIKDEALKSDYSQYLNFVIFIIIFMLIIDIFVILIFVTTVFKYDIFLQNFIQYDYNNIYQPLLKETGGTHIKYLIQKTNELLSGYRENIYRVRSLNQDIINLYSLSPFAFVLIDKITKKINYVNQSFLDLTGYNSEDVLHVSTNDILYQDFELYVKPFYDFLKGIDDKPLTKNFIIFSKKKKQIQVRLSGYLLHASDRFQYALYFEDIDKLNQLESDFEIFSSMYKFLMVHSNSMIQIADTMGKIKDSSLTFYQYFGNKELFVGKTIWDFIPEDHQRIELQQFFHNIRINQEFDINLSCNLKKPKDGNVVKVNVDYQLIKDKLGKTHFVIVVYKLKERY